MRPYVIGACCALVLLIGCQRTTAPANAATPGEILDAPIVTDPETGCQYIGYASHGLTPRLDATGKPMCGKGRK